MNDCDITLYMANVLAGAIVKIWGPSITDCFAREAPDGAVHIQFARTASGQAECWRQKRAQTCMDAPNARHERC